MSAQSREVGFFTLPREIRDCIYGLVLVCEPKLMKFPRDKDEPQIDPSLLRTCKQIHDEASLILYTRNKFFFSKPKATLEWFNQIGPNNFKSVKNIKLWVRAEDEVRHTPDAPAWYKLLNRLAEEATGLRHLDIYLDVDDYFFLFGPGRDVQLARELGKIGGLQSMTIAGAYDKRWPEYLTQKMGISVEELWMDNPQYVKDLRRFQEFFENLFSNPSTRK